MCAWCSLNFQHCFAAVITIMQLEPSKATPWVSIVLCMRSIYSRLSCIIFPVGSNTAHCKRWSCTHNSILISPNTSMLIQFIKPTITINYVCQCWLRSWLKLWACGQSTTLHLPSTVWTISSPACLSREKHPHNRGSLPNISCPATGSLDR